MSAELVPSEIKQSSQIRVFQDFAISLVAFHVPTSGLTGLLLQIILAI
jgi:hypothetical protein